MSVRRLLIPSRRTLRWILGAGAPPAPGGLGASGPSGVPAAFGAGRSRTEEYTGPSRPRRTTTTRGGTRPVLIVARSQCRPTDPGCEGRSGHNAPYVRNASAAEGQTTATGTFRSPVGENRGAGRGPGKGCPRPAAE